MQSGRWAIWPYGKGDTPRAAVLDWLRLYEAVKVMAMTGFVGSP
jgi:hypothetical protein